MLSLRSAFRVAPRLSRGCAFQTKIKEMEAAATKLAPSLPPGLKELAESGVRESAVELLPRTEWQRCHRVAAAACARPYATGLRPG